MDDEKKPLVPETRALVPVETKDLVKAADPVPAVVLARTLEEAQPRTFVHIDGRGQVRSPARYRAIELATYGAMGGLTMMITLVYGAALGLPGVAVGGAVAVWFGWLLRRGRLLQKATVLIAHDRLDEAENLLGQVARSWPRPKSARALIEQNLAAISARRGNFEEALAHQRTAMELYAKSGRRGRSAMARLVEYSEITTLVNLGRVGEARQRLEERLKNPPRGNYLQLQAWVAELYVCLGEGEHRLDADALHERARAGLQITGAAALLGLCAWAHFHVGDTDQGGHLLGEALDRREGQLIERLLPRLHDWMEAHAAEATRLEE
jgi:hypothetical protein